MVPELRHLSQAANRWRVLIDRVIPANVFASGGYPRQVRARAQLASPERGDYRVDTLRLPERAGPPQRAQLGALPDTRFTSGVWYDPPPWDDWKDPCLASSGRVQPSEDPRPIVRLLLICHMWRDPAGTTHPCYS
jgi:hypothetical protein